VIGTLVALMFSRNVHKKINFEDTLTTTPTQSDCTVLVLYCTAPNMVDLGERIHEFGETEFDDDPGLTSSSLQDLRNQFRKHHVAGTSVVVLGDHPALGSVAVKIPIIARDDETKENERMTREARHIHTLNRSNHGDMVVKMHGVVKLRAFRRDTIEGVETITRTDTSLTSIVMEACEDSVYDVIKRSELNTVDIWSLSDVVRTVFLPAAKCLYMLYCERLVHRDFLAKNILLKRISSKRIDVKVCDFDKMISDGVEASHTHLSNPSPSRFNLSSGDTNYGSHTDVYSFGMLVFEFLLCSNFDKRVYISSTGGYSAKGVTFYTDVSDRITRAVTFDPDMIESFPLVKSSIQRVSHFLEVDTVISSAKTLAFLAFKCIHRDQSLRPSPEVICRILNDVVFKMCL